MPLVIDHIAHVPQPDGLSSDALRTARRLVDKGNTWITLSGPYVDTRSNAPAYADVAPGFELDVHACLSLTFQSRTLTGTVAMCAR